MSIFIDIRVQSPEGDCTISTRYPDTPSSLWALLGALEADPDMSGAHHAKLCLAIRQAVDLTTERAFIDAREMDSIEPMREEASDA